MARVRYSELICVPGTLDKLCAESADANDRQLTQPAKNRKHRNFNVAQHFQLEWAGHLKHLNS